MTILANEHTGVRKSRRKNYRPGVFLDRDGVVNEGGLINTPEEFVLIEGSKKAIAILKAAGFPTGCITNQSGCGEDFDGTIRWKQAPMNRAKLGAIHDCMFELLGDEARLDFVKFCPHSKSLKCSCRKPAPGMIKEVAEHLKIDLSRSYMVGDMATDIEAALNAGVTPVLVLSGFDPKQKDLVPPGTLIFPTLLDFAQWLVAQQPKKKRSTKK